MTPSVAVVVPTFGREAVLLATLEAILAQRPGADELIVVDQTPRHEPEVEQELASWSDSRRIRWLRLDRPSIPRAMNQGLLCARSDVVVYFDDDILLESGTVEAHRRAHAAGRGPLVAGQVLQPGEVAAPLSGEVFGFRSTIPQQVREFMGGNFSVDRRFAIEVGGFDEAFVDVAYRFERDLSFRIYRAGGSIWFDPAPSVRHLREPRGGTRSYGSHLTSPRPSHSVGEYYFLMRHRPSGWLRAALARPLRSIATRHHLKGPWWVPVTLGAELAGVAWAIWLLTKPPRLIQRQGGPSR